MASTGNKRALEDVAAVNDRRVQPRHFHAGPNPPAGDEQKEAVRPTDASVLYRHLLENTFSFAPLSDLSSLMSVSKLWRSSVLSMPPCTLPCRLIDVDFQIPLMNVSPLRKHVFQLTGDLDYMEGNVDTEQISLMASNLPWLLSLICKPEEDAHSVRFSPSLRSLTLCVREYSSVRSLQGVLHSIGQLQHLESLSLCFSSGASNLSLAPLTHIATLTSLELSDFAATEDQDRELSSMHQLRRLSVSHSRTTVEYLLPLAYQMQLTEIERIIITSEEDSAALAALPTLTKLIKPIINCRTQTSCSTYLLWQRSTCPSFGMFMPTLRVSSQRCRRAQS